MQTLVTTVLIGSSEALLEHGLKGLLAKHEGVKVASVKPLDVLFDILDESKMHNIICILSWEDPETNRTLDLFADGTLTQAVHLVVFHADEQPPQRLRMTSQQSVHAVWKLRSQAEIIFVFDEIMRSFTPKGTDLPNKNDIFRNTPLANGEKSKLSLSNKQIAIVEKMASGLSNKEIAVALKMSLETVKTHVKEILHRLSVKNRTEAVAWFAQRDGGSSPNASRHLADVESPTTHSGRREVRATAKVPPQ